MFKIILIEPPYFHCAFLYQNGEMKIVLSGEWGSTQNHFVYSPTVPLRPYGLNSTIVIAIVKAYSTTINLTYLFPPKRV